MTSCWICGEPGELRGLCVDCFGAVRLTVEAAAKVVADPDSHGNTMHAALDELEWCIDTIRQALPSLAGTWAHEATVPG